MWQSKDDIIKDLASLNDFGVPGDQEPYKFLYSMGRGSKIKQKKNSEKFIDSRTGEVINVKDLDVPDALHKSKGRGTLLGSFLKSKLQLQQQLRLARPFGSGDEVVESYYRRNEPTGKPKIQTTPDSDSNSESENINSESQRSGSDTNETRVRVKAVRNSTLQYNALITGLLSKASENSSIELINDNCKNDSNVGFSTDGNINELNKFEGQKSLTNGFGLQDVITANEQVEEEDFLDKRYNPRVQSTKKKNIGVEIINDQRMKEKKEQAWEGMSKENSEDEACFIDETAAKKKHDERYRELGEKLSRIDKINSKVEGKTIYVFKCPESIDSLEMKSENEFGVSVNSVATTFLYNENDFPPL